MTFDLRLTFGRSVVGVDPPVVHVKYEHVIIVHEVSLVSVALVSVKVHDHHLGDTVKMLKHELCVWVWFCAVHTDCAFLNI